MTTKDRYELTENQVIPTSTSVGEAMSGQWIDLF